MTFLDLPERKIWYPLYLHQNEQCHLCAIISPSYPSCRGHQKLLFDLPPMTSTTTQLHPTPHQPPSLPSTNPQPNHSSNSHAPASAKPTIVHPLIAHPSILLPTMRCSKMMQPGAASDGATFDGTTYDGTTYSVAAFDCASNNSITYTVAPPPANTVM